MLDGTETAVQQHVLQKELLGVCGLPLVELRQPDDEDSEQEWSVEQKELEQGLGGTGWALYTLAALSCSLHLAVHSATD